MKVFVEKSKLENELRVFQGIFEKNAIIEILKNIKITALENGILELVATDLEIGLTSSFQIDVQKAGSFTVNGKDFYELISKMPEGIVDISEDNDLQIIITNQAKTCKYKMLGLQSSEYPQLPINDFSHPIKLSMPNLLSMINHNHYVISPELKFNLGGALLSISKNLFEMAATDGHRLSYTFYKNDFPLEDPINYIVSRKTLLEIAKIGMEGEIDFSYDSNNLFFKYKNRMMCSRIIDQKFPDYKSVIPAKMEFSATVNTAFLLQTLRRILIFKTRNNGVFFKFSKGKLIMERTTPEKGEGYDEISIDYNGKSISAGFNGNFVLDFLTHIHSDKIEIGMNSGESSFSFKPIEKSDVSFLYIIMPLNI